MANLIDVMKKSEMKTAPDNVIIMEYVNVSIYYHGYSYKEPPKYIKKALTDLEAEMLKRGLLTQEQVDEMVHRREMY